MRLEAQVVRRTSAAGIISMTRAVTIEAVPPLSGIHAPDAEKRNPTDLADPSERMEAAEDKPRMSTSSELEELGRRIRKLRVERRMTLKQVEEGSGLSATHLSE